MSTTPSLESLLVQQTQPDYLAAALAIAQSLQLPVTSWQAGDPTRSLLMLESNLLAILDQVLTGYIQGGYLDFAALPVDDPQTGSPLPATNAWLNILAQQVYNVIVPAATFATTTETLVNTGGGFFTFGPGDLQFTNPATGQTYHNTTGGTLTPVGTPVSAPLPAAQVGSTITLTVEADLAGSIGSAAAAQITSITALGTPLAGVTCTNPTAAVGLDQQPAATTIAQCRNKLASLSPNGPAGAYAFVALNPALTGVQTIAQARVYADSTTGNVTIYVAGPNGSAVSGSDVAAVQAAIETWATPLCITPTTISAAPVATNITYTIWLYTSVNQTVAQIQSAIQTALTTFFKARPIGGDIIPPATSGALYQSMIEAVIGSVFPNQTFRLSVTLPTGDTALTNGQVAALGTVTGTVNLVPGP